MEVGFQLHVLATLSLGKRIGTPCTGGGWDPGAGAGQIQKILLPPGFDPQTVQSTGSHYTEYAILACLNNLHTRIYLILISVHNINVDPKCSRMIVYSFATGPRLPSSY
jgi:hypothetical protein